MVWSISPCKTARKHAKRVQKAQNFPACGGPTRNNDKRLSIRFIKVDFGRRRRPKNFWGQSKLELNPPCLCRLPNKGGFNSRSGPEGRKILGVFGSVLIDFPLKNGKKTCQTSAKSPKFSRLRRASTKQR